MAGEYRPTILAFWQIDPTASVLLWPYLSWVSFAAALKREIDRPD
ncbi:MAG: hypothetical protein E5Y67_12740 [Mesorhizobium sp.]|nr:MAG: hypothetical protein E5Y87_03130 [Mesorhizobium sp.]TIM14418.1 MAG: hypothetical protein E5Y67_12740 [Mesorhizobium sp.]